MPLQLLKEAASQMGWKGTPEDLADFIQVAEELVDRVKRRSDTKATITVSMGDESIQFSGSSELRAWKGRRTLTNSGEITASVYGGDEIHIYLAFGETGFPSTGVNIRVRGTDNVAVPGALHTLRRQARKGRRFMPFAESLVAFYAVIGLVIGIVAVSIYTFDSDFNAGPFVYGGFGFAVFSLIAGGLQAVLTPRFEVLDPGDPRSRFQQWGKFVVSAIVLAGAVAAVVALFQD